jgi:hypothetical protein
MHTSLVEDASESRRIATTSTAMVAARSLSVKHPDTHTSEWLSIIRRKMPDMMRGPKPPATGHGLSAAVARPALVCYHGITYPAVRTAQPATAGNSTDVFLRCGDARNQARRHTTLTTMWAPWGFSSPGDVGMTSFERLERAVAFVMTRDDPTEKQDALGDCLDEIDAHYFQGALTVGQRRALVAVLLGLVPPPASRPRARASSTEAPDRTAITVGSAEAHRSRVASVGGATHG